MSRTISCPQCDHTFAAAASGEARCPHCQERIASVGDMLVASTVPPVIDPPPRVASRGEQLAIGWVQRFAAKIFFLLLLAPMGGVYLAYYQYTEVLPKLQSPAPRMLTCEELIAHGSPAGSYVIVSDFRIDRERISTNLVGTKQKWSKAFVPLAPRSAGDGEQPVRVLLETEEAQTAEDLDAVQADNRVAGLVYEGTDALDLSESLRLGVKYPDDDLKGAFFIKHGQRPTRPIQVYLLIGLGIVMAAAGIPLYYFLYRFTRPTSA